MSEYPWNETNLTFIWLSSLYNPFKNSWTQSRCYFEEHLPVILKSIYNERCMVFLIVYINYFLSVEKIRSNSENEESTGIYNVNNRKMCEIIISAFNKVVCWKIGPGYTTTAANHIPLNNPVCRELLYKHQNDIINVVLLFLLSTLNIFHTFF